MNYDAISEFTTIEMMAHYNAMTPKSSCYRMYRYSPCYCCYTTPVAITDMPDAFEPAVLMRYADISPRYFRRDLHAIAEHIIGLAHDTYAAD